MRGALASVQRGVSEEFRVLSTGVQVLVHRVDFRGIFARQVVHSHCTSLALWIEHAEQLEGLQLIVAKTCTAIGVITYDLLVFC
jgi:hypothetical protein